jgi:hypothetical protein
MRPQPIDRELFAASCLLRDLYARRGVFDREGSLSVDAAVVYGEALLRIARRRDEQAARRKAARPQA